MKSTTFEQTTNKIWCPFENFTVYISRCILNIYWNSILSSNTSKHADSQVKKQKAGGKTVRLADCQYNSFTVSVPGEILARKVPSARDANAGRKSQDNNNCSTHWTWRPLQGGWPLGSWYCRLPSLTAPRQSAAGCAECTVSTLLCAVCALQCAMSALKCAVCALQCAVCALQCEVCALQCAMSALKCEMSALQCAVCALQCTVCALQCAKGVVYLCECMPRGESHTPRVKSLFHPEETLMHKC